jgi:hypothetical protein
MIDEASNILLCNHTGSLPATRRAWQNRGLYENPRNMQSFKAIEVVGE